MPANMKEKVFSPFCTMKMRGLGLGLPIVRRAVTDHNGEIMLESGDTGTNVTVRLPAAVPEEETADETHSGR